MAWSTREMAQLAGTTVRAVRHYHDVGLLEEPRRWSNGYKQYGVAHLVRTLRIRRLTDLGFSLTQVAEMGDRDQYPHDALQHLHTELAQKLQRLQQARVELDEMLAHDAPTDLPSGLATAVRALDLSEDDRSLLVVLNRVLDPGLLMELVGVLRARPDDGAARAFDELDAGADEATREHTAERLLPRTHAVLALLPGLTGALSGPGMGAARRTVEQVVEDLYNPAQVDVLRRVRRLRAPSSVRTPTPRAGVLDPRAPARSRPPAVTLTAAGAGSAVASPRRTTPSPAGSAPRLPCSSSSPQA